MRPLQFDPSDGTSDHHGSVFIVTESSVYHSTRSCPTLNRSNRLRTAWEAKRQPDGTLVYLSGQRVPRHKRPCRSCWDVPDA